MSRVKGDGRGRLGGRQKGTPNRTTTTLKTWIEQIIDGNRAQIKRDFKSLSPKERIQMIEKFLPYIIPKQQAVSASVDINSLTNDQLDSLIHEITKEVEDEDNIG